MSPPKFQPADASLAPRYTGVRTFACLPSVAVPHVDVDAGVIGVPFDTATSFRSGTRFGPEAIRSASALLRPYHPPLDVDVFGTLSIVDGGDVGITPGNAPADDRADRGRAGARGRGRDRPGRARRRPLDRARRAARARRGPRPGRARAPRRARRHMGRLLRREVLPRDAVPARGRGGADQHGAVATGRHAGAPIRGTRTCTSRPISASRS
jgi:hypothetical protein